jgi:drug/metabolite transporter (DMT)-like permease
MDTTHLGELAGLITAFLWTLSALAWTSAGKYVGALAVSFIRLLFACVFLSIFGQLVFGRALPLDADQNTWLLLGSSGFLGFFIADVCLFKSFLLIGPRISLLLQTLSPPLAAVIAWLFMGDKLMLKDWIGMAMTLAGIVWVLIEQPEGAEEHKRHRHIARGVFLSVVSAVAGAFALVLSKKGMGDNASAGGLQVIQAATDATYIRVIGALAGYVVLYTLVWRWPVIFRAFRHRKALGIMTFGSFVGPFLGVILYMIALRYCHAGVVSTLVNSTPIIVLPFLIFLYHEKVSLRAAAGAILSVAGIGLLVVGG